MYTENLSQGRGSKKKVFQINIRKVNKYNINNCTEPCICYTWTQGKLCHSRTGYLNGNCQPQFLYKCNGYGSEAAITGICKKGQPCYHGEVGVDKCQGAFDD